ncbi:MAG: response regulator receiver [Segetibacter sp.]|jgi:CheY-like chemotaxis protein|nr:response regulator receiver [Segetibacter sp.]
MKADILVVEDDNEDIDFIKQAFSKIEGVSVEYFSNSFDVIMYLKTADNHLPTLIITDYNMPRIDGFNLVAFLKRSEKFHTIPLVVLTGNINVVEKERLMSAGVYKIYSKPDQVKGYVRIAKELIQIAKEQNNL